jgi:putative membrane protein insertion efficiency factor
MERQEDLGERGKAQSHPAPATRNSANASTGDCPGMGHCHSSAEFGGNDELFRTRSGTIEVAPSAGGESGPVQAAVRARDRSAFTWIVLALLRMYQVFLSPFFGGACKYDPSCSKYAHEAVERYGPARGSALALKRLLRCRPFTQGGFDPVPSDLQVPLGAPRAGGEPF